MLWNGPRQATSLLLKSTFQLFDTPSGHGRDESAGLETIPDNRHRQTPLSPSWVTTHGRGAAVLGLGGPVNRSCAQPTKTAGLRAAADTFMSHLAILRTDSTAVAAPPGSITA